MPRLLDQRALCACRLFVLRKLLPCLYQIGLKSRTLALTSLPGLLLASKLRLLCRSRRRLRSNQSLLHRLSRRLRLLKSRLVRPRRRRASLR